MFRILINILILILLVRLFGSVFRLAKRGFQKTQVKRDPPADKAGRDEDSYGDLTPYDVEDGEFEDVREGD